MVLFPNAKINIGLRIIARRSDGYHDIETVFYPVKLYDALEFVRSESREDELVMTGIVIGSDAKENLVSKAVNKLRQKSQFPILKIHLHKAIPAGAGLGGGSSDATCLLKSLNKYYSLGVSHSDLSDMALGLGSDCPFYIENQPAYATGRGEKMETVPDVLEDFHIVLINPGLHVSTKEAYSQCVPSKPDSNLKELIKLPAEQWKEFIFNDFEEYVFRKFPVIGEIKEALYASGAVFSLMSGSGSSVFGIFNEKPALPEELRKLVIYEGEI